MELRSSRELLVWLAANPGSGAFKRGEHLLSLAIAQGKMPRPASRFADWLYELRDDGLIVFDDSDAPKEVELTRGFAVTAAGRASIQDRRSR